MSDRLADLEIKIAWLERHVSEQDKVILGLHEELDRLRQQVLVLGRRLGQGSVPAGDGPSPADERPPHY